MQSRLYCAQGMDGPHAGTQGSKGSHILDHELFTVAWPWVHQFLPDVSSHSISAPRMDTS